MARADALERAFDEARGAAGAELLAGVDGVVGTLLDLVEVDGGWEEAFEAAAGASLAAVVVSGSEPARAALSRLRQGGATGAVLALTGSVAGRRHRRLRRAEDTGRRPSRSAAMSARAGGPGLPGAGGCARHPAVRVVLCPGRMVRGHRPGPGPSRPGGGHPGRRPVLVHRMAGPGRWRRW